MNQQSQLVPADAGAMPADWYKDAVIYQIHIKAYQDSNGDGYGDFRGLMQRLDHVQALGATAIWILPFYPSPLRDDGYDIKEYKAINPNYGDMDDFRAFVDEAHRRGLKVITELVINHTSDQHEWFQRARQAPKGSPERDFYVWSDDPTKWMDQTRVIFNDTHDSNWSWDKVAEQFYWHRFFDHQPDLNFDNPAVMEAVLDAMHFWLDMGVDGLRLDAIPYLVERDGTNNENLPETHDVLKAIRRDLDAHYEGRMLLAEANQWPEDTRPYFGEGDECHMGFHFPLMPRMYMAVAQEDRHPITDIVRQTPDIPEECQWGIFLRNHDELTLEMVTDRERDYLWNTYAADKRARINMGIRRRLAPLMQNDRRKIELLNFMLMSMPGTPILYYGDEIGMGDNIYLGDRDGVRTPMQWSADRNAGFSRADPQRLYLPTIQDPVHGYDAINVEAQAASPSSLLNWMRRLVATRQRTGVFGRGEVALLYPANRRVLAYLRSHEGRTVLCVANLSRAAQAVELDLSDFSGRVPIELTGQSPFPPVGDLPYLMTLPAYGYMWFLLADEEQAPAWHVPLPDVLPEFLTLTTRDGKVSTGLQDRTAREMVRDVLPRWLGLQRWFAGEPKGGVELTPLAEMADGRHMLATIQVDGARYLLPLSALWGEDNIGHGAPKLSFTMAKLRRMNRVGALVDGAMDEGMAAHLMGRLRAGGQEGAVAFRPAAGLAEVEEAEPRLLGVEQSNASIAFGDQAILKLYRRLRPGVQPEIEVSRFLTEETEFENAPALLGTIDLVEEDGETVLAAAFEFVRHQGDGWAWTLSTLDRDLEAGVLVEGEVDLSGTLDLGEVLGRRTAGLHRAMASGAEGTAFAADPVGDEDVAAWAEQARADLAGALDGLKGADLPEAARDDAIRLGLKRDALMARLEGVPAGGKRARIHGDYHLGQVLIAQNDVVIIDFEGEPTRPMEERVARTSPLRDVAGMLRSFDYAAAAALRRRLDLGDDEARARELLEGWLADTREAFLGAYGAGMEGSGLLPEDWRPLLDLFLIQKAAYEVDYELKMRPDWASIPIRGLLDLAGEA